MTPASPPLLVYHHLPRTGGTSLLAVILGNYASAEVVRVYGGVGAGGVAGDSVDSYRDWYRSLPAGTAVRCVASHSANLLMPTLERPFRALCLLRDPTERVWSLYHALRRLGHREGELTPAVETGREILRRGWTVADIYRELAAGKPADSHLHEQFQVFFDDQTRRILAPWRDTSELGYSPDAKLTTAGLRDFAIEVLDRHYVVGTKERYRSSLERFAAAFAWTRLDAERVDRGVGRRPLDPETRALILAHNQLDVELHAHFSGTNEPGLVSQTE